MAINLASFARDPDSGLLKSALGLAKHLEAPTLDVGTINEIIGQYQEGRDAAAAGNAMEAIKSGQNPAEVFQQLPPRAAANLMEMLQTDAETQVRRAQAEGLGYETDYAKRMENLTNLERQADVANTEANTWNTIAGIGQRDRELNQNDRRIGIDAAGEDRLRAQFNLDVGKEERERAKEQHSQEIEARKAMIDTMSEAEQTRLFNLAETEPDKVPLLTRLAMPETKYFERMSDAAAKESEVLAQGRAEREDAMIALGERGMVPPSRVNENNAQDIYKNMSFGMGFNNQPGWLPDDALKKQGRGKITDKKELYSWMGTNGLIDELGLGEKDTKNSGLFGLFKGKYDPGVLVEGMPKELEPVMDSIRNVFSLADRNFAARAVREAMSVIGERLGRPFDIKKAEDRDELKVQMDMLYNKIRTPAARAY